jgi:hypothetical protein
LSVALLLSGCASASDAPVTVRTRADNDLALLDFANQRFSGQRGFCLWTEYYRMYKTAETCGVARTPEEEHNFRAVLGAIEHAILANARGDEVAGLRLRQGKAQLDQFYQTLSDEDHLATCGDQPDLLSQVIQNYLSKRVSDSVLRQTQVKGDPFELFCSS